MFNAAEILAIAKAVTAECEKSAREALAPGVYYVDTTVRIRGTVVVEEGGDRRPTVSIPLKETMALLLHHCGVTRNAAMDALSRALFESIATKGKAAGSIDELGIVDDVYKERVDAMLDLLPRTRVAGKVKAEVAVTKEEGR